MNFIEKKIWSFWEQETSLTILSVVLAVHIFIIIPLGEATIFGRTIFVIFYILLLVAGMFVLLKNQRLSTIAMVLLVVLLAIMLFHSSGFELLRDLITAVYCVLLGWVVLLRTFKKGPITTHRILGAIVVYLLLAFVFALLFHVTYIIYGPESFKGLGIADRKEFLYFSFTSLTSTGYGDICPVAPFNRSLANLEGLIGQLYPGIIIARLVSMEFESSRSKEI